MVRRPDFQTFCDPSDRVEKMQWFRFVFWYLEISQILAFSDCFLEPPCSFTPVLFLQFILVSSDKHPSLSVHRRRTRFLQQRRVWPGHVYRLASTVTVTTSIPFGDLFSTPPLLLFLLLVRFSTASLLTLFVCFFFLLQTEQEREKLLDGS